MQSNTSFLRHSKLPSDKLQRKGETPEALRKLLLPRDELKLDDSSLSGSEISDVFEDIHREIFLTNTNAKKPKTKQEWDKIVMANFTDNFKDTILEIRKEQDVGDNMTNESIEDIEKILDEDREIADLPQSVQQRIEELLKDREYICSTPSQMSDDMPPTRKTSSIAFDAMSGVWRMLAVQDDKERFRTSSPGFNAFRQEEPHWLERPTVPWKTLDFSKHKCETWLNEQQN